MSRAENNVQGCGERENPFENRDKVNVMQPQEIAGGEEERRHFKPPTVGVIKQKDENQDESGSEYPPVDVTYSRVQEWDEAENQNQVTHIPERYVGVRESTYAE